MSEWARMARIRAHEIILAGDANHTSAVSAFADRLGFTPAQASEVLFAVATDDSALFDAAIAEGLYGVRDERAIAARNRARGSEDRPDEATETRYRAACAEMTADDISDSTMCD